MYVASVLAAGLPLVHILARGRLRTYFVYFVFDAGFVALNLLGSISPNIRHNVPSSAFHLLLLLSSLAMLGVYLLLVTVAVGWMQDGRIRPLEAPAPADAAVYRTFVKTLFLGACALAALFYVVVAPPVILRVDLFGQWSALISQRMAVVYSPSFHWFALAFFEIPALTVLMAATLAALYRQAGRPEEARYWRRTLRWILPPSIFLSVGFLHIIVVVYLAAGVGLVAIFFRGRIPVRLVGRYGGPALVAIFLLYCAKKGFTLSGAFVVDVAGTVLHRVFEVYPWAAATTVYLFPERQPFLHGASMINLFGMLHFQQVDLAALIYPYIYNDVTGGAPVPAAFESWANFGWTGALLTIAITCVLAVLVTLLSWMRSPFAFCISVYLTLKSLLIWQAALWFGMLEPTVLAFLCAVGAWFWLVRAARTVGATAPNPVGT
jgi:hypothetical protein